MLLSPTFPALNKSQNDARARKKHGVLLQSEKRKCIAHALSMSRRRYDHAIARQAVSGVFTYKMVALKDEWQ